MHSYRLPPCLRGILFLMAIGASHLAASTIYTTGGTPANYDTINAYDIGPGSGILGVSLRFTPGATAILGQIDVPIKATSGTGNVVVSILTNKAGNAPGSVIESLTTTVGSTLALVSIHSILHPTLNAGTSYWVAISTTGSLELNWNVAADLNLRGTDLLIGSSWVGSSGSTKTAVDILSAAPAPEPSMLALAGVAIALMARFRQRTPR